MIILTGKEKLGFRRLRPKQEAWIEDKFTKLKGIDVSKLGNGHLSCPQCLKSFFGIDIDPANDKVRCGCMDCGWETRLLFPTNTEWGALPKGNLTCIRGHNRGMAVVKCDETVCMGCGLCDFEIRCKVYDDERKIIRV